MHLCHLVLVLLHSNTCVSMPPARQVMIISCLQLRDKNPRKYRKGVPAGGSWVWIQPRAFLWECVGFLQPPPTVKHMQWVWMLPLCVPVTHWWPVFLPALWQLGRLQPRVTLNLISERKWMFVVLLFFYTVSTLSTMGHIIYANYTIFN